MTKETLISVIKEQKALGSLESDTGGMLKTILSKSGFLPTLRRCSGY